MTDAIALLQRRHFLTGAAGLAGLGLSACTTTGDGPILAGEGSGRVPAEVREMYGPIPDERFPIPAARIELVDPKYWRQVVPNPTGERPGTILVDTPNRFLYLVREDGQAMRYGVGVGRAGFAWQGRGVIAYKREWPTWPPPSEMVDRQPQLEQYRSGMAPGLDNPLGPRALYIFENGKDTLYRLHGNMDERSIGQAVSSGCVRMLFQDVIDLYQRVPPATPIVVVQS